MSIYLFKNSQDLSVRMEEGVEAVFAIFAIGNCYCGDKFSQILKISISNGENSMRPSRTI